MSELQAKILKLIPFGSKWDFDSGDELDRTVAPGAEYKERYVVDAGATKTCFQKKHSS